MGVNKNGRKLGNNTGRAPQVRSEVQPRVQRKVVIMIIIFLYAFYCRVIVLFGWRRGVVVSGVRRMNEVNPRQARLVRG